MSKLYRIEPITMFSGLFRRRTQRMPYYYIKKIFILLEKRHVVYPLAIFLLVLVLSGHILSLQGKKVSFENQQVAATTAANVSDFFLTASIVTFILYMPKNSEDFFQFFSKLYPEGNQLFGPLLAIKKNHFWRNFLICNLCIGSLVSLNASFFLINFGWSTYKYVIFRDLEFYMYNLLLLLLLALVRKLEMRFAELNELLEYKTEHFLKTNSNAKQNDDEAELNNRLSFILNSEHFYSVRTFRTMHYDLCRLVKRFNEMFGRIILSMIVFSIANILAKVTFIIDFYVTPRSEEEKHKWSLFVGIVCAWIFANLGQAYLFSYYGEQITKEGEKTTRTCFYLLNKVPFQTKNEDENLVQDELKLFALQSYSNIPFLSAGGFFDINFRVLGLVISSVTSYLMVIIQFLLRPQTS